MVSHVQVPAWEGKENTFVGRKKQLGDLLQLTESPWLHWFVLARKEKESFFFLLGSTTITRHGSSPF